MAKKYAPALFEVMNRQKNTGKLGVPKWWKPGAASSQTPAEAASEAAEARPEPTASDSPAAQEPEAGQQPEAGRTAADREPEPKGPPAVQPSDSQTSDWRGTGEDENASDVSERALGRMPAVWLEAGRVHMVLSPIHAAVVGGALLIVLLASYQLGRGVSGQVATAGGDDGLTLLDQKPNPSVLEQPDGRAERTADRSGPRDAADQTETAPPEDELIVGLRYVVLDTYAEKDLASAEFVQNWLQRVHDVPTVLMQRKDRSYRLIGTTGFDDSIPGQKEACKRYIERIESLGRECGRELGRAKLQPYVFASPFDFVAAP